MPPLAQRNLFHDKVRLAVTLTGSRTTAERVDTKILETLVELDPESRLPDGLRVDPFIVPDGGELRPIRTMDLHGGGGEDL